MPLSLDYARPKIYLSHPSKDSFSSKVGTVLITSQYTSAGNASKWHIEAVAPGLVRDKSRTFRSRVSVLLRLSLVNNCVIFGDALSGD